MFEKTLIRCPKCEEEGLIKTIGLLFPNGLVSIQREFTPARGETEPKRDYTIVKGDNFSLLCGYCGEEVYRKEANVGTNSDKWVARVSWTQTVGTFGTL